ncbi:MAG: tetratricopeptide repeat protein [Bacteroidota bacterium]|nr:tetratricopeptide repeat protein [Bacteroidota bacterium]
MNYFRLLGLYLMFQTVGVYAQKSDVYTNETAALNKAIELYNQKQYQAAQILFEKVKSKSNNTDIQADCAYYIANCAIRLEQQGADMLMEQFIEEYPSSTKQNNAYLEVGEYYFEQGAFSKALTWYDKVDENTISNAEKEKYNFQKGYTYFVSKNKRQAEKHLNSVYNSPKYGHQAKYYLGYLAYEGDNYNEANKYFDQISDQAQYKGKLSYFQVDMNFKLGKFHKAIEEGIKQLPSSNATEKSELNKIIGESYFNLGQYEEAIPYLTQYKGKKGKWNNTDFYLLGYSYYKIEDYENAISQFNKIIDGADFVAQNAYYHLGESYLKSNKKQQALNAFKNASEMSYDVKIQEDAYLNYAKLSYEIGNNYQSIPSVLASFMEKYPDNPNNQEVEELLINSYITSKNYKEALVLLEKNKNFSNRAAYQKVTFYRGLELFADGDYSQAIDFFKKSIQEPQDAKFVARATFWKAETEFTLSNFNDALLSFRTFENNSSAKDTPEYKNLNYNLAYAYFKLKDYTKSAEYFQKYMDQKSDDNSRTSDAQLRLADSYFVAGKYWPAMEAYNKAIEMKGPDQDYAAYQKALSYGFVEKGTRKQEELESFVRKYTKSQYHDDALFELGNSYTNSGKNQDAIATFERIVKEHPISGYTAKAILKQGLIYYNIEKDDLALVKFKKVAAEFPNSPEAIEAVSTAKNIYVDNGKVDEYASWVKTLNYIEVSDSELDTTTFDAAERQYLQNNTKAAIAGFTNYLAKFPKGIYSLKAEFYLAEMYIVDDLPNMAQPLYEKVMNRSRNQFTEQSLVRLSAIHLKKSDFESAIPVLKRLEKEAEFPQNVTYAQVNLMRSCYNTKDYIHTVQYAEKVLENDKANNKVKSDAQIMIARSAMQTGNEALAKTSYKKLEAIAQGELAAEALYYDAYFKNKEQQYEESNKVIQRLTKDYSGYKYFGVKGLVVMAKNFYAMDDSFQATHILESVIKNFSEFKDILDEAQTELDKIKNNESKRNSSVN